MFKHDSDNEKFFSTAEIASLLGVSKRTVQKMVDLGRLKAYITQGGHRKILFSSLNAYCRKIGIKHYDDKRQKSHFICILHSSRYLTDGVIQLGNLANVKIITHPIDFISIHEEISALFVDARIPLKIPSKSSVVKEETAYQGRIFFYNCEKFQQEVGGIGAWAFQLIKGDINKHFIEGFREGLNHSVVSAENSLGNSRNYIRNEIFRRNSVF
jgi:excisionase family DNA binding protein